MYCNDYEYNTPAQLPAAHWCRTLDGGGPEEREQRTQRPAPPHSTGERGDLFDVDVI